MGDDEAEGRSAQRRQWTVARAGASDIIPAAQCIDAASAAMHGEAYRSGATRELDWSLRWEIGEFDRVWVARDDDGAVVGVCALSWPDAKKPEPRGPATVKALYVAPRCQGRGIGQALLEHALTDLDARGCALVVLEVDHEAERARKLYERAVFIVGETLQRERIAGGPLFPHYRCERVRPAPPEYPSVWTSSRSSN